MNNAQKNAQTPAFPVHPVADQFGTVHLFPGQTKQEYLAAQIFLQLHLEIYRDFREGNIEGSQLPKLTQDAIFMSYEYADMFYKEREQKQTIVKTGLHAE
jgi:hypothetical protein